MANAADGDGAGAAFASSDSGRHARPLTALKTELFDEPFALQLGGSLPSVRVAYETYGTLDANATNAVLVCHAISGDSHVARHDADDDPGWWDALVGPGKALDTSRFFVICSNVLGGCRGTTGPNSENPATGKPYAWWTALRDISIGEELTYDYAFSGHLAEPCNCNHSACLGIIVDPDELDDVPEQLQPLIKHERLALRLAQIELADLASATEDTRQLGGDFVIAPDGRLSWGYWSEGPADRPFVHEVLDAVERAAGSST